MSDHRTRSGARLRTDSRVVTARSRTMAMEGDYTVRRCAVCQKRLSVFRPDNIQTCSRGCKKSQQLTRRGERKGGRSTKWRPLYERARLAVGQWISHDCESRFEAERLSIGMNQRKDFEARRDGLTVFVRLVVAA